MIRKTLTILAATAALAGLLAVTARPGDAQAASQPGVGSIILHSWTKPYHDYLRTAVLVYSATHQGHVTYRISRHTSSGWKVVKSTRSDWDWMPGYKNTGQAIDVQKWYAWEFHHVGQYRWQATLYNQNGSIHTDTKQFRVYVR